MVVNGSVYLIYFTDNVLLMSRNTTDFLILTVCLETLLNVLVLTGFVCVCVCVCVCMCSFRILFV